MHPTGPASHLNVDEIASIVNESMKTNVGRVPREIMEVVRADVLKRLENSTVGISGANVVAAEEGSIVLVHNEGQYFISFSKRFAYYCSGN